MAVGVELLVERFDGRWLSVAAVALAVRGVGGLAVTVDLGA